MATPTSNSVPAYTVSTPSYYFDALLGGTKWGSSSAGVGVSLTYSFPPTSSYWPTLSYSVINEPWTGGAGALSASQQSAAANALQSWANVANISFTQLPDNNSTVGEIRFAWTTATSSPNEQAHAYFPSTFTSAGDVWLNSNANWNGGFSPGSFSFMTLLHEIGHALGLKHSFEASSYNSAILGSSLDGYHYTLMSYSAMEGVQPSYVSFNPTTPMLYDIAAIQYLYGANMAYHAGNDTYNFYQGQDYFQTIWDASGTDTIIWNASTESAEIDLRAGFFSDLGNTLTYINPSLTTIGTSKYTVAIAYNVTIENATGGQATDTIIGNAANNLLDGQGGADSIYGDSGNDSIEGGPGNDTLVGAAGNDSLEGGDGNDYLVGGTGNDIFDWGDSVRVGIDTFIGGVGNDTYVVSGGDVVTEYSGEGTDLIWANTSYSLVGTTYIENLYLYGTSTATLTGNGFSNNIVGNDAANTIIGGDGNDSLEGAAGNDLLTGGLGNDSIFLAASGDGIDTISDFESGDTILVTSAIFSGPVTNGTGASIGLNQIQCSTTGGMTTLFIGTNTTPGADLSILLNGIYSSSEFIATGTKITYSQVNHAPTLANPIPDQAVNEDASLNFTFAANAFNDQDINDALTYTATRADGSALPGWLNFNSGTRTFSGTPANGDVGAVSIKVTATDGTASVSDIFTVSVTNTNDAPTLANPISDKTATENTAFSYTVPANTFSDIDAGDTLTFGATLSNGSPLPSWLNFNPATHAFSGTPGAGDIGIFNVRVTASDGGSASVYDEFLLTVSSAGTGGAITLTPYSILTDTALELAQHVLAVGSPVNILSASYTGSEVATSFFTSNLGFGPTSGVLLTSGDGTPPVSGNTVSSYGISNPWGSDVDLLNVITNAYPGQGFTAEDAAILEFTFTVPAGTTSVRFDLIFGSEEYPEYTDQYVDVAAVLVDGVNYALFNGSGLRPLSVDQANLDADIFFNNGPYTSSDSDATLVTLPIEYDGVSKGLSVIAPLGAGEGGVHSIKIGIADTNDGIFDSGLFIGNMATNQAYNGGLKIILPGTNNSETITGGSEAELTYCNDGNDFFFGNGGDDVGFGNQGNDSLNGGDGFDNLLGGLGNDSFSGGNGGDYIKGGVGNDWVSGGNGNDTLKTGSENDFVDGGDGDDYIASSFGNDTFVGGLGNDTLSPGQDDDLLTGGAGNDIFFFQFLGGHDTITDFASGDRIDLTSMGLHDLSSVVIAQVGLDTVVTTSDGTSVTFFAVSSISVGIEDFLLL